MLSHLDDYGVAARAQAVHEDTRKRCQGLTTASVSGNFIAECEVLHNV